MATFIKKYLEDQKDNVKSIENRYEEYTLRSDKQNGQTTQ